MDMMVDTKDTDRKHPTGPKDGPDVEAQAKSNTYFLESVLDKSEQNGTLDYSGAHKKTDPAEIALVKKLDRYIMPT